MKKFLYAAILFLICGTANAANHWFTGLPIDSNGWTDLPAMVQAAGAYTDARIVYVSSTDGVATPSPAFYSKGDAAIGSDPFQPTGPIVSYQTFAAAYAQCRTGYPDIILFKRGDSWNIFEWANIIHVTKSGRSNTERHIVAAYGDPALPRPYFFCRNIAARAEASDGRNYIIAHLKMVYDLAWEGIAWVDSPSGLSASHSTGENILLEGCHVEGFGKTAFRIQGLTSFGIDMAASRRNTCVNNWSSTFYFSALVRGLAEENVLDLVGDRWNQVNSGNVAPQAMYLQYNNGNIIANGNILSRCASSGIQLRSDGTANNNVFVRVPMALGLGHEQQIKDLAIESQYNLVLDGVDMVQLGGAEVNSRGWGIYYATEQRTGDYGYRDINLSNNIVAVNNSISTSNNRAFLVGDDIAAGIVSNNIVYDWMRAWYLSQTDFEQSGLTISNNLFHGGPGVAGKATYTPVSAATLTGNSYFSSGPIRYEYAGATVTFPQWTASTGETGGTDLASDTGIWNTSKGTEPSVANYMASLGETATHEAWITAVIGQRYGNWQSKYTHTALNNWVRDGFGLTPISYSYTDGSAPPLTITCYLDADGDGYSDGTSETVTACSANYYTSSQLTEISGDCNDSNAAINPAATDVCGNGVDEDCSGADAVCIPSYWYYEPFDYENETAWDASSWGHSDEVTLQTTGCYSGNCIRFEYADANYIEATKYLSSIDSGAPEGYMSFRSKVTNKQASWPKFLKFFGTPNGSDYSNWTLGTHYYQQAALGRISHGGGSPIGDSQYVIKWNDGTNTGTGTINYSSNQLFTWPDENYHDFVVYWKLNTNGQADGAWKVWIDGDLQLDVSGVINRADTNPRSFTRFSLGDYTDRPVLESVPTYYIWYDDVKIGPTLESVTTDAPAATITCYLDADGDGYGDGTSETVETCSANYYLSSALTATSGDCNDSNAAINPAATEICGNGIDEDCSGADLACTPSGLIFKPGRIYNIRGAGEIYSAHGAK